MVNLNYKNQDNEGSENQFKGLSIPTFDWSKPNEDKEDKRQTLSKLCFEENPYFAYYMDKIKDIAAYVSDQNEKKGIGRILQPLDNVWLYAVSKMVSSMDLSMFNKAAIEPHLKEAMDQYIEIRCNEVGPIFTHIMRNKLQDEVKKLDNDNKNNQP